MDPTEETTTSTTSTAGDGFVHWCAIEGLHLVKRWWAAWGKENSGKDGRVQYRGKIKLHGNNGGIRISEETEGNYTVTAQSRNQVLSAQSDLAGFAKWVAPHQDTFIHVRKALKKAYPNTSKTIVFGEWCGSGIQSKVSLCNIGKKIFAVFSILVDDGIISDPKVIASFFPEKLPADLHIIPWLVTDECGEAVSLNYDDVTQLEEQVTKINQLVTRIDQMDPWVKDVFSVEGPGEGVVWYPVSLESDNMINEEAFEKFSFKTKGEKHAVVKQDKPAQLEPQVSAGVPEFVTMFVTTPRGEQGISKVCGDAKPTKANTGQFCKWMTEDIKKESVSELEASKLTWKQVEKEVTTAARAWFLEYVGKL
eukprot:TRINITY_DN1297_c0_g1_i5.p1 TRINITY_DN1297_c0_g1~~TRINITY_DN1297_c0_g1_i5.p1  ORF type:complete len:365 (+),score=98.28 TRINITY_DN1297_c0_g1_i5:161-1255(+)